MKRIGTTRRRTLAYRSITMLAVVVMTAAALLPYIASADNPYSTISPLSEAARDIQFVYTIVFWMALVVFIAVQFAIAYTALRYRRRHEREARPEQVHGNKTVEIIWTIVPAIILIVIFVPTVDKIFELDAAAQQGEYRIEVYGKQWWWEVHYAYPETVAEVVTANEIYVPVGRKLQFELYTNNVIHSFWVPQLTGKMDLIPGHINRLGFTVEQPGVYYGECAEFCGESHALMRFKVIALDQASFDQWAASMTAPPGPAAAALTGDVTRVPDAFGLCLACHRVADTNAVIAPEGLEQEALTEDGAPGAAKFAGPHLTNYACRTTVAAGTAPNDVEHLREWLYDPAAMKPGNHMATVIQRGMLDVPTADETDDPNRTNLDVIVDYLVALQPEGGCPEITGVNAENVVTLANDAAGDATAGDEGAGS